MTTTNRVQQPDPRQEPKQSSHGSSLETTRRHLLAFPPATLESSCLLVDCGCPCLGKNRHASIDRFFLVHQALASEVLPMAEVQDPTSSFAERDIDPWKKGRSIVGFRHEFPESWLTVRLARHESIRLSCNCMYNTEYNTYRSGRLVQSPATKNGVQPARLKKNPSPRRRPVKFGSQP